MKKTTGEKRCSCGPTCSCRNCSCGPYATFFSTLANENRLAIITALLGGGKNVTGIAKETGLEQTAVSHALKQLEERGFVTATRAGKYRIYTLDKRTIKPLFAMIDGHARTHCADTAKACCCGGNA